MSKSDGHLVLHVIGIKGITTPERISEATGLDPDVVDQLLEEHRDAGLVAHRSGRITGWSLTPAGRSARLDHLDRERSDGPWVPAVDALYARFGDLNETFKQLCAEWQAGLDPAGCIERLRAVDAAVGVLLADLARALPRTAPYRPRLHDALVRLSDGDDSAFLRPLTGSYHDVWMELHEDLLRTLGRDRTDADT